MGSLSPLNVGEDVSGFQYTEQNKTLVKKKLVFHASVLFILVVLAVIAALADTQVHAFYFISNTFISNARLKFQNLSRQIFRTELLNLCQMIALFPNSILNAFLSGRVRPIFGKSLFR